VDKEVEITKFIQKVKGKTDNWVEKVQEKYPTEFPESKDVYQFCHRHELTDGKFLTQSDRKKEAKKYKNALVRKAEKFWKGKNDIPERNSLNWLLEPEFGAERASILIRARRILSDTPLVINVLEITLKVNKDD
jgi:hypothetical protein